MKKYDYLIIGAGLFGSVFTYRAIQSGKKVLVLDKRPHIGGNLYTEMVEGINVHKYGAHIFHTSDKAVWEFVNSIVEFNRYTNSPIANYKGKLYNLPFNMNTFYSLWGTRTPEEARLKIEEQIKEADITDPKNLEEQAISLVGKDIYEILIKGYTEKQWGRKATEVPAFIISAGLFGSVFTYRAIQSGKKVLVLDKRPHIGGNLYTEMVEGINVHKYGAHIFHTSDKAVWEFVNSIVEFNRYTNSPIANYKGKLYNLPFNMNTFYSLWGTRTPEEARLKIEEQIKEADITDPKNLEEQAISLVGKDIYEILIKGYTEKQWGRKATEVPAFIIKRIPVRFTFDNNYFNDKYQGIPIGGYTNFIRKLLAGAEIKCNVDYNKDRNEFSDCANKVIYTGPIDEYFDYCFGKLEYRSLKFEEEILDIPNYQGNAVVNYTEAEIPYTRIIEHKHFEFGTQEKTVISKEYSLDWKHGVEPYYPINDLKNNSLYQQYKDLSENEKNVLFGGRLAEYKYYDMHQIVKKVLDIKEI